MRCHRQRHIVLVRVFLFIIIIIIFLLSVFFGNNSPIRRRKVLDFCPKFRMVATHVKIYNILKNSKKWRDSAPPKMRFTLRLWKNRKGEVCRRQSIFGTVIAHGMSSKKVYYAVARQPTGRPPSWIVAPKAHFHVFVL